MSLVQQNSVKTTVYIDKSLHGKIHNLMKETPYPNQTQVINTLLNDAFVLREEMKKKENEFELVSLQSLYILRELAKLRSEGFLEELDNKFKNDLPEMKELMIKQGVHYAT